MREQIRNNVFETNSSSIHTLTLCSDSKYQGWVSGKLVYSPEDDEFIPREKALEHINMPDNASEDDINTALYEYGYLTYDKYFEYDWRNNLETYDDEYTTESGEIVHAFGRYGYDG